ncbi:MAG: hypothetical protein ACYDA8_00115, partial [Deferrisomatales bacterium]
MLLTSQEASVAARSRFAHGWLTCADAYEDGLVETLLYLGPRFPEKPVLFLTHDFQVKRVAAARGLIESHYHLAVPSVSVVEALLSKEAFSKFARSIGVLVPREFVTRGRDQFKAILGEISGSRWVVKPAEKSDAFEGLFGKAVRLGSDADAGAFAARLAGVDVALVTQEWIDGGDADVSFCLSYRSPGTRKEIQFTGRKIRQ